MCCVVGYVGRQAARGLDRVLCGLELLEYRGYDSAGIASLGDRGVVHGCKVVGGVTALRSKIVSDQVALDSNVIIGHTRWSTHGAVTVANAHPVHDCRRMCYVVHNGIIENEASIRVRLSAAGHQFSSSTDSELIAHLLEEASEQDGELVKDPLVLLHRVVQQLEGAYAFVALLAEFPGVLCVVRNKLPLCLISMPEGGILIASDPIAAGEQAVQVQFVPDQVYGIVSEGSISLRSFEGIPMACVTEQLSFEKSLSSEIVYPHAMLREITEQSSVILNSIGTYGREELPVWMADMARASRYICIGSGTSYFAGLLAQYMLERSCGVSTGVFPASEVRDLPCLNYANSWVLAFSQSGETADTLEAMRFFMRQSVPVIAVTNSKTSTMAREATGTIYLGVGVERAVASTKTFTAHGAFSYVLSQVIGCMRRGALCDVQKSIAYVEEAMRLLSYAYEASRECIDTRVAPVIARWKRAIFIGRGVGYVIAAEAALKLKELAYCFTEVAYGGELKHGPLALIEPGIPLVVCSTVDPSVYRKLVSNVHEVRARNAFIIVIAYRGQDELAQIADIVLWIDVPQDSLLASLLMNGVVQYLAYRVAVVCGCSVDRPRNLAKSVTVE